MDLALLIHRLQFGFTITFHYLFPQLTMGLAPLIVVLKTLAIRPNDERYDEASRFWARIFGINFTLGVVTGIPLEFQFGTNWARFSRLTGGVIGQPLVMEGVFSFFLESAFLGLFVFGERRLSRWAHWWTGVAVFIGSWASGFFIVVTDAWMQHPVAYVVLPNGGYDVASFWGLLLNPWALIQYAHTMCGALTTGCFAMAATGAYYLLDGSWPEHARIFVRTGVIAGALATAVQIFPTGDVVALKTTGVINGRARGLVASLWMPLVGLTFVSLAATLVVRPTVLTNYREHPILVMLPLVVAGAIVAMWLRIRVGDERGVFAASSAFLAAMLGGAAAALYPALLPSSTDAARDLTIFTAATGRHAMSIGLIWWTSGIAVAIGYFVVVYRLFRGKVPS